MCVTIMHVGGLGIRSLVSGGGFNTTLVIHTLELSVCSKGNKQLGGNLGCVTIRHSAART